MQWRPPDPDIRRTLAELRARVGDQRMKDYLPRNDYVRYVHTGAARTDLDLRELLAAGVTHVTFQSLSAFDPREVSATPAANAYSDVDPRATLQQALFIEIGPGAKRIVDALDRYLIAIERAAAERARSDVADVIRAGSFRP